MSDTLRTYESDTPETCEAIERWQQGKINIFDEMARLERERDEARLQVKLLRVENNHNWQANDLAEQAFRERDEARAERDEWIAKFRADEQLINEAMIPHPENPEL